ncbi:PP2C family protein-serine/threonine phosphatase [Marinimicrobium alkaliphilum]|uniref:PP2C family protein-serine/threonine phosphatase n=1 Tax=Marinimicrobium alkaliphilum TaxID=2202654 RepID=UPI000DBA3A0A|nr:protein phosphatase 2C domain-containing protein [Marinimicrobium alkaliphilum]
MQDTTYRRPIYWESHAATHPGAVREHNEDAYLSRGACNHWAVADGMGGHAVGDVASQEIVSALARLAVPNELAGAVDCIEDCLLGVNGSLQRYARQNLGGATIGSTLVDLIICGRVGVCLWAGDSRLYRYRRQTLTRISRDHSQVEDMVTMGLISAEEARTHQCSNVITRAVGVEENLLLDLRVFDVQLGDMYLLCSDGLHGVLSDEAIADRLECREPAQSVEALMAAAMQAGAPDNVTAVVTKGIPGAIVRQETQQS